MRLGFGVGISSRAALGGRAARSAPLFDENGTIALIDFNFEVGEFRYSNQLYTSLAAWSAGTGIPAVDHGDGTYTIGPISNLPFTGYNAAEGTVLYEYIKTGTTQNGMGWSINQAGDNTKYIRLLPLGSTNLCDYTVFRTGASQAAINTPVGAAQQQNYRFRHCSVYKTNDFSNHCNGELIGTDTSGNVSDAVTNVALFIGHRAGLNKFTDGTSYRWAYFPRAVSSPRRPVLSLYRPAIVPGAWTFFNDARAVSVGGEIWAGAVSQQLGRIVVGKQGGDPVTLGSLFQRDDHNNPSLLRRSSDGRWIAHYSLHTHASYFQRITTNPDDLSAWDAETNLDSQLGANNYAYANLVELDNAIYNFHRCQSGADSFYTTHYSKTTNGGTTWAAVAKIANESGQRSYFRCARNGGTRVDFLINDGHPDEFTGNSTYHFYMLVTGGVESWHASDGTNLGALPFQPSAKFTRVWDGTGGVESWVWGIAPGPDGYPRGVFATFPNRVNDHRYHYARWTGSAWSVNEICTAGGTLYNVVSGVDGSGGSTYQDHYSGGVCIDPDNVNTIYCSRPTKSDGTIGVGGPEGASRGTFQIWKGVTTDGGATWTMTQLTFGTEDSFRPYKVAGTNVVAYVTGRYVKFTDYQTRVVTMTV